MHVSFNSPSNPENSIAEKGKLLFLDTVRNNEGLIGTISKKFDTELNKENITIYFGSEGIDLDYNFEEHKFVRKHPAKAFELTTAKRDHLIFRIEDLIRNHIGPSKISYDDGEGARRHHAEAWFFSHLPLSQNQQEMLQAGKLKDFKENYIQKGSNGSTVEEDNQSISKYFNSLKVIYPSSQQEISRVEDDGFSISAYLNLPKAIPPSSQQYTSKVGGIEHLKESEIEESDTANDFRIDANSKSGLDIIFEQEMSPLSQQDMSKVRGIEHFIESDIEENNIEESDFVNGVRIGSPGKA